MLFTALLPALALASTTLATPTPRAASKTSEVKVPGYIDWRFQYQCNVDADPTLLEYQVRLSGKVDWGQCVAICEAGNYNLAGIKDGVICGCGDASTYNGRAGDQGQGVCNIPCAGNSRQLCGGVNSWSILYRNGKEHIVGNPA